MLSNGKIASDATGSLHGTKFKALKGRYRGWSSLDYDQDLDPLSSNKVTGDSVNFPIAETCQPSKICANTCYGLSGPIVWKNSLNKQGRNYLACQNSPQFFAERVIEKCSKRLAKDPKFFLRWNGVGDLFSESITALKLINAELPDLPIWCVTRIPKFARQLFGLKNIWIHFSLDAKTLKRKDKVIDGFDTIPDNLFFSYQCDKNEAPKSVPKHVSVLFFDRYKITSDQSLVVNSAAVCPLNKLSDIENACYRCRRCFNGDAIKIRLSNI